MRGLVVFFFAGTFCCRLLRGFETASLKIPVRRKLTMTVTLTFLWRHRRRTSRRRLGEFQIVKYTCSISDEAITLSAALFQIPICVATLNMIHVTVKSSVLFEN
jgi:hypothetical protein